MPPTLLWLVLVAMLSAASVVRADEADMHSWHAHLLAAFHAGSPAERPRLRHVGIIAEADNGRWYVAAVLQGYPAQQAGLRRGDRLLGADERPFHPASAFMASDGANMPLTLHYERNGAARSVALMPIYENLFDALRNATDNSLNSFIIGNKRISYLQLWALSRNREDLQRYRQLLQTLQHSDALILDLRHSYGFFDDHHADAFFPTRSRMVSFRLADTAATQNLPVSDNDPALKPPHFEGPVVVISNAMTAGGAEMLLTQLSRSPRAMITGETSAGTLDAHWQLRTASTDARLLIDGQPAPAAGVPVDVEQGYALTISSSTDPQFQVALDLLLNVL